MVEPQVNAVEAARSVLIEIIRLLKDHGVSGVVIGGWAADLLPSKGFSSHRGTVDVDLVLDNREVPGHNETTLMEALFSKGYRQGNERFQYYRTVNTDIGPLDVRVDLLTPETEENSPGDDYRTIHGVNTLILKGGNLALANTVERAIEGKLPDGEKVVVSVNVISNVPFLVLKSLALWDRREGKDAYDIYHRLKNYPDDLEALVKEFEPHMHLKLVREGLDILAKCFSHLYSEGPKFVVDFIDPEEPEERNRLKRDSYELVNFLLKALEISRISS